MNLFVVYSRKLIDEKFIINRNKQKCNHGIRKNKTGHFSVLNFKSAFTVRINTRVVDYWQFSK